MDSRGLPGHLIQPNSEYHYVRSTGVRLRGISFVVKRETAQTVS